MFVYQRVMIWHRYDQFLMGYDGFYAGSMVVLWLYDYMTVCIVTWQGHDYMTFFWGCIMMALGWFCGALCLEGFLLHKLPLPSWFHGSEDGLEAWTELTHTWGIFRPEGAVG
jgi:hypothetical protein